MDPRNDSEKDTVWPLVLFLVWFCWLVFNTIFGGS